VWQAHNTPCAQVPPNREYTRERPPLGQGPAAAPHGLRDHLQGSSEVLVGFEASRRAALPVTHKANVRRPTSSSDGSEARILSVRRFLGFELALVCTLLFAAGCERRERCDYLYSDPLCPRPGAPPASTCREFGDLQCHNECRTDDDCAGTSFRYCSRVGLFAGGDSNCNVVKSICMSERRNDCRNH
jgi:hypothetical protein